jgi:hypothetical protein
MLIVKVFIIRNKFMKYILIISFLFFSQIGFAQNSFIVHQFTDDLIFPIKSSNSIEQVKHVSFPFFAWSNKIKVVTIDNVSKPISLDTIWGIVTDEKIYRVIHPYENMIAGVTKNEKDFTLYTYLSGKNSFCYFSNSLNGQVFSLTRKNLKKVYGANYKSIIKKYKLNMWYV